MVIRESKNVALANAILRGQAASLNDLEELVKRLICQRQFGYGRRLLAHARMQPEVRANPDRRRRLAQQHAICTYKDPGLPAETRLRRALEILQFELPQ